jgi:23S rRNA (cytosine1962-C5)-methyltransferase
MAEAVVELPEGACAFIAGGGRDVEAGKVAAFTALAAGTRVKLLDPGGDEAGLALADPDNGRLRVMAVPADGFAAIDGALLGWRVERALALRRGLGLPAPDATYRLINAAGDGLPGLACDVLGRFGVLWAYGEGLLPSARQLAEAVRGFAGLDGVVIKLRRRGGADDGKIPEEVSGRAPPPVYEAREHGVPFEIHPLGATNVGLFTDMREHRRSLARFVGGKRVLNLFSYSGALSVAAARAGAAAVTSVDTSAGVHAWAQGNFRRSDLPDDPKRWRFEAGDAVRFLARAIRDKERYDVVLIDPPTFSTARGSAWSLERDYPALIEQAATVLSDGGILWLAANSHELAATKAAPGDGSLLRLAHKGIRAANRTAAVLDHSGLPPDYPTLVAQPRDRYLQVAALRL